jgi:hypothetical protein
MNDSPKRRKPQCWRHNFRSAAATDWARHPTTFSLAKRTRRRGLTLAGNQLDPQPWSRGALASTRHNERQRSLLEAAAPLSADGTSGASACPGTCILLHPVGCACICKLIRGLIRGSSSRTSHPRCPERARSLAQKINREHLGQLLARRTWRNCPASTSKLWHPMLNVPRWHRRHNATWSGP